MTSRANPKACARKSQGTQNSMSSSWRWVSAVKKTSSSAFRIHYTLVTNQPISNLRSASEARPTHMKPPPFDYVRPASVEEAVRHLEASDGDGKILAGGQSLVPLLNFRLAGPSTLVDLNAIPDLAYVRSTSDRLSIGAMTRMRDVELDPNVGASIPMLREAASWVGHVQIRNRGTFGGSLAHADPAAEFPALALLLDATMTVVGSIRHAQRGGRGLLPRFPDDRHRRRRDHHGDARSPSPSVPPRGASRSSPSGMVTSRSPERLCSAARPPGSDGRAQHRRVRRAGHAASSSDGRGER